MLQYIKEIIESYVRAVRENVVGDKAAVVRMNNFKGQVTEAVSKLLECY